MEIFSISAISLALAMDAFAVTVGLSLSLEGLNWRQILRLAFCFGFFQFLMTVLGWLAGNNLIRIIKDYDHWIAFGLLLFIGGKMIIEAFLPIEKKKETEKEPTKGFNLLLLSVATSIDALAVGLSLGALRVPVILPAVIIGVVAFILTVAADNLGRLLGKLIGRGAEIAGGIILVAIGFKVLFEHLA